MARLNFVVYSWSPETRARVTEQLLQTDQVLVTGEVSDLEELSEILRQQRVNGLYLDLDQDAEGTLEFVSGMPEPRPTILLGAQESNSDVLLRAMRLGCRDFFQGHELTDAAKVLREATQHRAQSKQAAPTVAVVGAKGGVGSTMVACELAVALQETGLNTIVCDMSRRLGDVAIYFDLRPRFDLADLVRHQGEFDAVFIDAVVSRHSSQVSALAAPSKIEDVTLLTSGKLDRILKFLQTEYDCIVLDVPWDFDDFCLRSLDMSNEILLVTTPEVSSLTHAKKQREMIEGFGALPERIHTLANRCSKDMGIDKKQLVEFLERDLVTMIPDLPEAASKCADEGLILRDVPEAQPMREAVAKLRDLVCEWCELDQPTRDDQDEDGLMSRLRNLVGRR
jgi:pilus assembly protein CpaE